MRASRNGRGKEDPRGPSPTEEHKAFEKEHEENIRELDKALDRLDDVVESAQDRSEKTPV